MSEYLKLVNDDGVVFIDDAFQNYHYVGKLQIKVKNFTLSTRYNNSNTSYFLYEYTFGVNSAVQPLVAVRAMDGDISIVNTTYLNTSGDNWSVTVFIGKSYFDSFPELDVVFYNFGTLPANAAHSLGIVFQVKNAQGRLIFDSGRRPMKVEGYFNYFGAADWKQVTPGVVPATFSTQPWNIPNYNANKTYAVVNSSHIFMTMYSDPNVFISFISYVYRSGAQMKVHLTGIGWTFILDAWSPAIGSANDSFILIDVTDY